MMKKNALQLMVLTVLMISSAMLLINCGGGSDDAPVAADCTTCESVNGSWQLSESVEVTASSPAGYCSDTMENFGLNASQINCQLTVTETSGPSSYSGQICDRTIKWTGSYPEDGGTTVTAVTATLSADGLSLSGNSTWTWSDDTGTCKGTSTFTAYKL